MSTFQTCLSFIEVSFSNIELPLQRCHQPINSILVNTCNIAFLPTLPQPQRLPFYININGNRSKCFFFAIDAQLLHLHGTIPRGRCSPGLPQAVYGHQQRTTIFCLRLGKFPVPRLSRYKMGGRRYLPHIFSGEKTLACATSSPTPVSGVGCSSCRRSASNRSQLPQQTIVRGGVSSGVGQSFLKKTTDRTNKKFVPHYPLSLYLFEKLFNILRNYELNKFCVINFLVIPKNPSFG